MKPTGMCFDTSCLTLVSLTLWYHLTAQCKFLRKRARTHIHHPLFTVEGSRQDRAGRLRCHRSSWKTTLTPQRQSLYSNQLALSQPVQSADLKGLRSRPSADTEYFPRRLNCFDLLLNKACFLWDRDEGKVSREKCTNMHIQQTHTHTHSHVHTETQLISNFHSLKDATVSAANRRSGRKRDDTDAGQDRDRQGTTKWFHHATPSWYDVRETATKADVTTCQNHFSSPHQT